MVCFRFVAYLSFLLFNIISIKATDYYSATISIGSTVDAYLAVDSNILTGVYLTLPDFNSLTNNRIKSGPGIDNVFVYTATNYGIDSYGIAFTLLDGTSVNIYYINILRFVTSAVNVGSAQLIVSHTSWPATAFPTSTPTSTPTTPTATPTSIPTAVPTATPTSTPTSEPTSAPTATPTPAPTAAPTATPTATPTLNPTAAPSPHKQHNKKPHREHDEEDPTGEGLTRTQAISLRGLE